MAIEKNKLQLEGLAFKNFMKDFNKGKFGSRRLGQAFYDHFKLERLSDQQQLDNLHAKDGEHALRCIRQCFKFN